MDPVEAPQATARDRVEFTADLVHYARALPTADIYRLIAHCLNELDDRDEKLRLYGDEKGYSVRGRAYRIVWDASTAGWLGYPEVYPEVYPENSDQGD